MASYATYEDIPRVLAVSRERSIPTDAVAKAIQDWMINHGVPPTLLELQRALKSIAFVSTRTLLRYLDHLEDVGMVTRLEGARGLRLQAGDSGGEETLRVPFFGGAPAGRPKLAEEDAQAWIQLPRVFLRPPSAKFYLVRVDGDSMNRAKVGGLLLEDGDLVLVRHQVITDPGQVVTALVDREVVIKRFIRKQGYCVLMPDSDNKKHKPIIVRGEGTIQGIVVKVFKEGAELLKQANN
jgi:repressor LexA